MTGDDRELTHLDEAGRARMVDVGAKPESLRVAVAEGWAGMRPETVAKIVAGGIPKGDVFAVARLAGIAAAKRTSELVPLCHPVRLTSVEVEIDAPDADEVHVVATARAYDRTGVEMEALTAVSGALLAIYDMVKGVDREVTMTSIRLLAKSGGRSGDWRRGDP